MIIASRTQFHVESPWGSRFQPGEGPSRGLLRDYEPSDGTRMEQLAAGGVIVVITGGAARCPVMNIITPWGDILTNITAAFGPSPPPITTRV